MKHTDSFPKHAISWLLSQAKISIIDVDKVVLSFDIEKFKNNDQPFEQNTIYHDDRSELGKQWILRDNHATYERLLQELHWYGINSWEVVPHHLAHAGGAYYLSGFKEANVLVIDGRGETNGTSIFKVIDGQFTKLQDYSVFDSLGHVYTYATYLAGLYTDIGQEGKTMGLAPFGKKVPELYKQFHQIIRYQGDRYSVDRQKLYELDKLLENPGSLGSQSKLLAYQVQKLYEEVLTFLAKKVYAKTKIANYALAGGVSLNCEGNRALYDLPFVKQLFIQPAANDGGTALGAAIFWATQHNIKFSTPENKVYLGPSFSNEQIKAILDRNQLNYQYIHEPERLVAKYLAQKKVVGWFQGRMEYGPRALGNRSILANPQNLDMKKRLNVDIKLLENWRPFAPSVLEEDADQYFENFSTAGNFAYMTVSFNTKKSMRKQIPGATNIDGTARIQVVSAQSNPKYHQLLKEFKKLTGVSALLNTSLNNHEPIVCTPEDAIRTFYASVLDVLFMSNYLLMKKVS
ncbi:hypothetical protein FCS83_05435 [Oenococcus sp. UCMA 17063]|nr:hypothetical protein [Oenococcus sp. UCMA 17063]